MEEDLKSLHYPLTRIEIVWKLVAFVFSILVAHQMTNETLSHHLSKSIKKKKRFYYYESSKIDTCLEYFKKYLVVLVGKCKLMRYSETYHFKNIMA